MSGGGGGGAAAAAGTSGAAPASLASPARLWRSQTPPEEAPRLGSSGMVCVGVCVCVASVGSRESSEDARGAVDLETRSTWDQTDPPRVKPPPPLPLLNKLL